MKLAERRRINQELISGVLTEDARALSDLYDKCFEVARRHARHIPSFLGQDPQDFASEVFLALVKDECASLQRLRDPAALSTYIREVFLNLVRLETKKQPTPPVAPLEELTPTEEPYVWTEETKILEIAAREVLGQLPAKQRVVYSLWLQGESYEEIAKIVGIPIGSVGTYIHRTNEKLRQELGRGT